jgi:hypothetical protein
VKERWLIKCGDLYWVAFVNGSESVWSRRSYFAARHDSADEARHAVRNNLSRWRNCIDDMHVVRLKRRATAAMVPS